MKIYSVSIFLDVTAINYLNITFKDLENFKTEQKQNTFQMILLISFTDMSLEFLNEMPSNDQKVPYQ